MGANAGPFLVTPYDPTYRAAVGYLSNWGYWFRVIDSRLDEDDQDIEIHSGGIDSEMPHLVQLIQDCGMYVDWTQHTDVLRELVQYDAALTSKVPRVRRLLRDALVADIDRGSPSPRAL